MKDCFLNKKFKYTYSNAALVITIINVCVYVATDYLNFSIKGIPLEYWLSIVPYFISRGYVWQFVTYMFVHGSFSHLMFNMYALLMFGMTLERTIGTREFVFYYFFTGTIGGILSWICEVGFGNPNTIILGASGAVYAILFLGSVFYPRARVYLFFIIPLKMPFAMILFVVSECYYQIIASSDGIAHLTHLLCILVGWIYCMIRYRISPWKVWKSVF